MSLAEPQHSIVLTRVVNAPARNVYAAWTEPSAMERWLGRVDADVRVGGRYHFESPAEGGKTYTYTGADPATANPYPNERIEIRLVEIGPAQTELTFVNAWDGEALSEESRAEAGAAWSEWLDRMEKSVREGV